LEVGDAAAGTDKGADKVAFFEEDAGYVPA
jgi:hypothetical protein